MVVTGGSAGTAGQGSDDDGDVGETARTEVIQAAKKAAYKGTKKTARRNSSAKATHLKALQASRAAGKRKAEELSQQQQETDTMRGYLEGSLKRKAGKLIGQGEVR